MLIRRASQRRGTFAAPAAVDNGRAINADEGTPLTGNVLDNDLGGQAPLTVTSVNGSPANVGVLIATAYGHLIVYYSGTYSYTPDTANADVATLPLGDTLIDTIPYIITESGPLARTSTANIIVEITGVYVPSEGPTALWDTSAAHDTNGKVTIAGDLTTYAASGSFGDWGITLGDLPIILGDKVGIHMRGKADASFSALAEVGLVLASIGEVYSSQLGEVGSVSIRPGSVILNGAVYDSDSNWQSSISPGDYVDILILFDRSNPAAQVATVFKHDGNTYGTPIDLTSTFGSNDVYPAAMLQYAGQTVQLMNETDVLNDFNINVKNAWTAAKATGFVAYSGAVTGSGGGGGTDPGETPPGDFAAWIAGGPSLPPDVTFSNDNQTVVSNIGGWPNWRIMRCDTPIAVGDKVAQVIELYAAPHVAGGPVVGLVKATGYNPSGGAELGGASHVAWRSGDIVLGGVAVAGSIANWGSGDWTGTDSGGTSHGDTRRTMILVDRSDPDNQWARCYSLDECFYGPVIDIGALFGTNAVYIAGETLYDGSGLSLVTQTAVEDPAYDWGAAWLWKNAKANGFTFLSQPLALAEDYDPLEVTDWTLPALNYFSTVGWNLSYEQITAHATSGIYTDMEYAQGDWMYGPNSREATIANAADAGFGVILCPGMQYNPAGPWSEAGQINDYEQGAGMLIDDPRIRMLAWMDELDLYWGSGLGQDWASPINWELHTQHWMADHGGNLGGLLVISNLVAGPQFTDAPPGRQGYLNSAYTNMTSCDTYRRTASVNPQPPYESLYGGYKGGSVYASTCTLFTAGFPGWTTYIHKFGGHPDGSTGQIGKPHAEWLAGTKMQPNGLHLTAAEQNIMAGSAVVMGVDMLGWFTTDYTFGQTLDQWSPASAGLPGGMRAGYAPQLRSRLDLIQSKGVMMKPGGGRTPFILRLSPVIRSDPSVDFGHTYAEPLSVLYMPGGFIFAKLLTADPAVYYYLGINLEEAVRTLTLEADDPWYADLNGLVMQEGEFVFLDHTGTMVAGW
jgi:VCBS repeat-containing protein